MLTKLDKKIVKPFDIAPVQYYTDNKNLITVQNIMDSGANTVAAPYGFIVGAHDSAPIYLDVEAHLVTIGKTGSGKGVATAISNLVSHGGSAVSLEIGGSTFKKTYNYRKHGLKQNIYVFDPHNVIGLGSSNYNPMDDLDPDEDDFYSRVLTMASALTSDSEGHKEQNPYFRENPRALIAAMITYLKLADPSIIPEENKNFVYLAKIFSEYPSEAWNKHITALKEWRGRYEVLLNQLGNYLGTAQSGDQNARSLVSSTAQWLVKWTSDDALGRHMVSSDFSMRDLRDKKTTIYIVMQTVDDYITYQPWLRLILQSAIDNTPNKGDGGKGYQQEDRILFMIDELTQLGHLQAVTTGAQTVRQKGIVFWSLFQDYASLRDVYGEERASAFVGASDVVQIFRNHEDRTLEYISKHLGRYMVYVPTVSEGEGIQIGFGEQESVAKAIATQKTWQIAQSNSVTQMAQQTKSWAVTLTNFRNWGVATSVGTSTSTPSMGIGSTETLSSNETTSTGGGSSEATMEGGAATEGSSTQKGTTNSEGGGTTDSETKQKGSNKNEGWNTSYTLSYQPMVIDGIDFREIKERLAGNRQILFVDSNAGSHCTLDEQARYYSIPFLKDRADGPPVPEAPAFPDPPKKTIVQLTPVPPVNLEGFKLDKDKLNWTPPDPVAWHPPAELAEWGQGVKDTRDDYEAARYRLDKFDEGSSFFQKLFANPVVQVATAAGVATSCYIGGSIAAAGITFGALMATGMVRASWRRHRLVRAKHDSWKDYTDMRGAAMKMISTQLVPVIAAHNANQAYMEEAVNRQHELVTGNGNMESVLADRHQTLKERLEEHRSNLEICRQAFRDIRSGVVSGWSSGDWLGYVHNLRSYYRTRDKFFDFDKGDYLPAPDLVTPAKLGAPPPRTLFSSTAPMPEMFEADRLAPAVSQPLSVIPEKGMETRKELQAYFETPLTGYDLPDDVKTVGDAVTRRAELADSDKKRHQREVKQMDAALESMNDPLLEKFDGLVKGYATGLRDDEDAYTQLLRQHIREGQKNVMDTIGKIRQFNGQVMRLNDAQVSFEGFARRLDEVRAAAHHRAHARAIRDMDAMEQTFEQQTVALEERGPLVPPKNARKRPDLKVIAPPK